MAAGRVEVEISGDGSRFRSEMRRVESDARAGASRMGNMLRGISAAQVFGLVGQMEGFATALAKAGDVALDVGRAFRSARSGTEEWYQIVREMPMGISQVIGLGERLADTFRGDNLYGGRDAAAEQLAQMQRIGEESRKTVRSFREQQEIRMRMAQATVEERDALRAQIEMEQRIAQIEEMRAGGTLGSANAQELIENERELFRLRTQQMQQEDQAEREREGERIRRDREEAGKAARDMAAGGQAMAQTFATAGITGGGFGAGQKQKVGDEETHDLLREMLQKLGSVPQGLAI